MQSTDEVPVPPQYQQQELTDFRHFGDGPRGYKVGVNKYGRLGSKRKLEEYAEQVEVEQEEIAAREGPPAAVGRVKRPKLDTVGLAKVSGRGWKEPGKRANTLRNPKLSTGWEKKMKIKAEAKFFRGQKLEAKAAHGTKMREAREKREAAKKRKEENQRKSAITQRVTPEKARKMMKSKKLRKKLVTIAE